MNSRIFQAQLILAAIDRASAVVNSTVNNAITKLNALQKKAEGLSKSATNFGRDTLVMGGAAAAGLAPTIKAFSDLEDSTVRLKTVMMKDGGLVSANFEKVNAIANDLGNRLPGTTADFQNMMAAMLQLGVSEESIIGGVGESAANLAIVLKMPFEEAAEVAAKLKQATGVADKDMLKFMDSIARTRNLGADTTEMRYAWSRSAGTMKLLGIQGLEASKSMNAVFATLIRNGASGETVGTGMSSVLSAMMDTKKMKKFNDEAAKLGMTFEFVDKKTGQFKGVEHMIGQLDRLKGLNATQRFDLVQALLGPGQDASFMNQLIDSGYEGFNEMQKQMKAQAQLTDKVTAQLGTLKNVWDAASGTFTNTIAGFAETFSPELKELSNRFAKLSQDIGNFIKANPMIAKFVGLATMGFIAVAGVLGVAGLAVAGFAKAWSYILLGSSKFMTFFKSIWNGLASIGRGLVTVGRGAVWLAKTMGNAFMMIGRALLVAGRFMLANPILIIITAIAVAAFLIYKYWDKVGPFFGRVWNTVRRVTVTVWNSISAFFRRVWAGIVNVFSGAWNWIKNAFLNYHPLGMIIKNWTPITQFFGNLWDRVKGIFNSFWQWLKGLGTNFYQAGSNIVESIWEGIKAMAYKPVQAIKDLAAEIRSYMPFSPAKKGALRDIHRIRLVETIASSIKPNSMLAAMKSTAMATFTAVPKLFQPVTNMVSNFLGTGGASKSKSSLMPNQRTGGGASIVYSPTITISGGGTAAKEDFKKMLQEHKDELMRLINKEMERNTRKSFA